MRTWELLSGNNEGLTINLRHYHRSFAIKLQVTREDVAFVGFLSSLYSATWQHR